MVANTAIMCMALNLYNEVRGEIIEGQIAVAYVLHNRAKQDSKKYCKEVYKKDQFSWTAQNKQVNYSSNEWKQALLLANTFKNYANPIGNATFYHSINTNPYWAKSFVKVGTIGNHVFYVKPN